MHLLDKAAEPCSVSGLVWGWSGTGVNETWALTMRSRVQAHEHTRMLSKPPEPWRHQQSGPKPPSAYVSSTKEA